MHLTVFLKIKAEVSKQNSNPLFDNKFSKCIQVLKFHKSVHFGFFEALEYYEINLNLIEYFIAEIMIDYVYVTLKYS